MSTLPVEVLEEEVAEAPSAALKTGLLLMIEANLAELRHCSDLERRRELAASIESKTRRLSDDDTARHISFLVARGVQPAHERLDERGCHYKNLSLNTALVQQIKLKGYGICPHCSRVVLL